MSPPTPKTQQLRIGDLVSVKANNFGIVIALIVDPLYVNEQVHIKVHIFKHNKSSWFLPDSISVISALE